jgi:hypothetical protein
MFQKAVILSNAKDMCRDRLAVHVSNQTILQAVFVVVEKRAENRSRRSETG